MNKIIISTIAAAAVLGTMPALAGKAQPPGAGAQTTGATTTNASIQQVMAAVGGAPVSTAVITSIASLPGATSLPGGGVSINVDTGGGNIVTLSIDGDGNVSVTPVGG